MFHVNDADMSHLAICGRLRAHVIKLGVRAQKPREELVPRRNLYPVGSVVRRERMIRDRMVSLRAMSAPLRSSAGCGSCEGEGAQRKHEAEGRRGD
jgi:hypothetical protein